MRILAAALAAFVLAATPPLACQTIDRGYRTPPTPAPVEQIVYALPFTVETPFINTHSSDRGEVSAGVLVVLRVDPAYIDPRDAVLNPVLYAGDAAVIRLNRGYESGHVIGIVPGDVDLAGAPVWFGSPELPERLTPASTKQERERAEGAGIRPFPAKEIAAVRQAPLAATDVAELLREVAAPLIYEYAPQDRERADTWRLPVAGEPPAEREE